MSRKTVYTLTKELAELTQHAITLERAPKPSLAPYSLVIESPETNKLPRYRYHSPFLTGPRMRITLLAMLHGATLMQTRFDHQPHLL